MVLVVGLVLTASMAVGTRLLRNDNEQRLLEQRVNEAATVASSSIAGTQAPLSAAAALAEATNGDPKSFQAMTAPMTAKKVPYVSTSLWPTHSPDPRPLAMAGVRPKLAEQKPERIRAVLDRALASPTLTVENLLGGSNRRLGYADAVAGPNSRFVVYAEAQLPQNRRARIAKNSAFADFDYALYLGDQPRTKNLLASSNSGNGAIRGHGGSAIVPFGDRKLLIVLSPRSELGGTLLLRLPWVLAALGLVITLAAAALVERLSRRREYAEKLALELERVAAENARLLADQRTVAYTLQQSLLPEKLPEIAGLELAVRYVAGVEGVDIGGDWYDVIPLDGRVVFVMGDVSGRGLRAATIMASLRYAIHAYAAQGDPPSAILAKLSKLLRIERDGGFATILCGSIDFDTGTMTIASAGHLPPLLIGSGDARFVEVPTGVPVGVTASPAYESIILPLPPGGTLVTYTDGLIERRGENLDAGFDRLRAAVLGVDGTVDQLLTELVDVLTMQDSDDDTAVLGLRWTT